MILHVSQLTLARLCVELLARPAQHGCPLDRGGKGDPVSSCNTSYPGAGPSQLTGEARRPSSTRRTSSYPASSRVTAQYVSRPRPITPGRGKWNHRSLTLVGKLRHVHDEGDGRARPAGADDRGVWVRRSEQRSLRTDRSRGRKVSFDLFLSPMCRSDRAMS